MRNCRSISALLVTVALGISPGPVVADDIRIAVASNFAGAMQTLARKFEDRSGHKVVLSFASTGKHFAQIKHGAPFDAFFAADVRRPQLLEQEGLAVSGSRFTYAVGRLVLWSPKTDYVDSDGKVLEQRDFRFLAIANPRLAPYGEAARQVLESHSLWESLKERLVRGENINQAFQFVASGNAELGFVAYSQLRQTDAVLEGSYWEVPRDEYSPIEQHAVLLKDGAAARAFLEFVRGTEGSHIIRAHGYDTPG